MELHSKQLGAIGVLRVVDVFAIYIPQEDLALYVNASQILNAKSTFAIRVHPSENNQEKFVHRHTEFLDFKKALRGHTQSTPTD